jgi:hypothetical protein
MNRFFRIKESSNYERLRNSIEYRYERQQWIVCAVIMAIAELLSVARVFGYGNRALEFEVFALILVMINLVFLPILAYFGWRVARIFRKIDSYTFCEAVLDRPRTGYKGAVSFLVEIRTRSGATVTRETHAIFGSSATRLEDYVNKRVLLAYNEETDTVIVIQKV